MLFTTNRFGERTAKWDNNIHPDNPNFQQRVFWQIWIKPDGRFTIGYKLDYSGKIKFIYPASIDEALAKYCPSFTSPTNIVDLNTMLRPDYSKPVR